MSSNSSKSFKGVKWTAIASITTALLYLIQISILSRFLSKEDFGIVSLCMVVLGFAQAFADMGFSNAIIHYQKTDRSQLDTLYWLNVICGILVTCVICLLASTISNYYNEPELENVLYLASLNFFIQPFGLQYKVLLQKELKFISLAKIEVTSSVIGFVVSLFWIFIYKDLYALVVSFVLTSFIATLGYFSFSRNYGLPSLKLKIKEVRDYINFGLYQMGERTLNYFNGQFDILLIGKLLGVETVGVYAMTKQVILRPTQLINPIITKVTFPMMAKVQNDRTVLGEIYHKSMSAVSSINFPLYGAIFILSPEIVNIIFGENWNEAIPIMQILSIYAALRSTGNPVGSLLLARGKANLGFYWNLGLFFLIPISVYLGSSFGLHGVCYSLMLLMLILIIPNWSIQVRSNCESSLSDYLFTMITPAIITTLTCLISYYLFIIIQNDIFRIVGVALSGAGIYLIISTKFNTSFIDFIKSTFLSRESHSEKSNTLIEKD